MQNEQTAVLDEAVESDFVLTPVVEVTETVQPIENLTRFCSGCR